MNTFGSKFRVSLFGESHGKAVGVVMDGVPAGMPLDLKDFAADIDRRKGGAFGTTPRTEEDAPEILSGVYNGYTTGAPLTIVFRNENIRPGDYKNTTDHPRPSHADLTARLKYGGYNDPRGGGHFSGRLTLPLVAAGVVAKKMLGSDILIWALVSEIGGSAESEKWPEMIAGAQQRGDSVGGVITCMAKGVPAGWGEPFFDSVESVASHLLFSIPGIKGVEFGNGFEASRLTGSQNNDPIMTADGQTATNNSGGINGGITNGNTILARVAVKPTPSISIPQDTFNFASGRVEPLAVEGRHDACIALRMPPVVEAAMAIALAQFCPAGAE